MRRGGEGEEVKEGEKRRETRRGEVDYGKGKGGRRRWVKMRM